MPRFQSRSWRFNSFVWLDHSIEECSQWWWESQSHLFSDPSTLVKTGFHRQGRFLTEHSGSLATQRTLPFGSMEVSSLAIIGKALTYLELHLWLIRNALLRQRQVVQHGHIGMDHCSRKKNVIGYWNVIGNGSEISYCYECGKLFAVFLNFS